MANAIQSTQTNAVAVKQPVTIGSLLNSDAVKKRFEEVMGKNSAKFISSIISVSRQDSLIGADPQTILGAASIAASLDLPINPSLGCAYIVAYNNNKKLPDGRTVKVKEAQFQIGYKGIIQLALRSGQYEKITVNEVYEGEIENYNRFTDTITWGEKKSDKVIGYLAYVKMVAGFEKFKYMTVEDCEAHATQFSKNYKYNGQVNKSSLWASNFDGMAKKTCLKLLLSKFGTLSIEMQTMAKAINADQAVVKAEVMTNDQGEEIFVEEEITEESYVDNPKNATPAEPTEEAKDIRSKIVESASKTFNEEKKETLF